ncbi:HlyD family secretion protein [Elizabethkingia anophelis]|uniref:HlyD family secretion protein n=1 Tax=Elizabethkingia anophelis TaxID=1117645 RepID=UPI00301BC14B
MNMETTQTKQKKYTVPAILLVVIIAGSIFGIKQYTYYQSHEDTDDAQVDGDISAVVARVGGYINTINFEDNQRVTKGQTLVTLEDHEYRIKLEQALAAQKTAGSKIGVSETQVSATHAASLGYKARIEEAKARLWQANQDYDRYAALARSGSVPQQTFDKAKAERDIAKAAYISAEEQYKTAVAQIGNTRSELNVTHTATNQQQTDVDYAKLLLSYTNIKAPVSGIVTKRRVQMGQLLQAGQTLFAVVDENNLYVTANFKETQMQHIRSGQKAKIIVDAYPDEPIEGIVHNYAGTTGAKMSLLPPDNATGNFVKVVQRIPVKIKINASAQLLKKIRPGMNVEVSVVTK